MDNIDNLEEIYRNSNRKKILITVVVFIAACIAAFGSIFITQLHEITPSITWRVLCEHLQGGTESDYVLELVVWKHSVPRAIFAVVVGATLAVGGVVMQSLMRNPLADPYTTGVSSGASLGVALAIMLGISIMSDSEHFLSLTVNAFIFALIPTMAIMFVAQRKTITPTTMILAGIAVMYVFRSITSLLTLTADPQYVEELYMWNVGTVGSARWENLGPIIAVCVVGCIAVQFLSNKITIMTVGDKSATSLGISVKQTRILALLLVALLTAVIVSFTGTIGFMGLVAPHVARIFVGSNVKYLLPCSAAFGALILTLADCVARYSIGIPVGVVTSIIGGPIFIFLLIRESKKTWF